MMKEAFIEFIAVVIFIVVCLFLGVLLSPISAIFIQ